MMALNAMLIFLSLLILPSCRSQFVQPPKYSRIIVSPANPNITISYSEPLPGTCLSSFSTQKQYTGYVNIPPYTLAPIQQNYSINTFFWFVEARTNANSSPLTVFMNGGPGSSSLIGFFQETGPCQVVQLADGSYGTDPRIWGWDRSSNMIFVDQPVQTGLSYDTTRNLTYDFLHQTFGPPDSPVPSGLPPFLFGHGTFSSQSSYSTANTTKIAAHAVWHFLQAFLSVFPQYSHGTISNINSINSTNLNLFTESYGGIMGPVIAKLFEDQNALREKGSLPASTIEIHLTSLGIINGLIDQKIQMPYYPKFASNNTYGITAIDLITMYNALSNLTSPGGCIELISICRSAMDSSDPNGYGDVPLVNEACNDAQISCSLIQNVFLQSGLSIYDIRQNSPSPFPSNSYVEYLNNVQVQQSIGSMINYTDSSNAVFNAFIRTGDVIQDDALPDLSYLLSNGVRVTLIYGDADYICNWIGGEAIAKALVGITDGYKTPFTNAGYAEIVVNSSYVGGEVRQYGNLSFVRVYDAGHQVPAYQPETAFTVFARTILGTSIATGEVVDLSSFHTNGPSQSTKTNKPGSSLNPICWIRSPSASCTNQQLSDMLSGKGVVINGVWYERLSDFQQPPSTVTAGKPGSTPTTVQGTNAGPSSTTVQLTGVYTATATPKPNSSTRFEPTAFQFFITLMSAYKVFNVL